MSPIRDSQIPSKGPDRTLPGFKNANVKKSFLTFYPWRITYLSTPTNILAHQTMVIKVLLRTKRPQNSLVDRSVAVVLEADAECDDGDCKPPSTDKVT
jgi:hypothetical protein